MQEKVIISKKYYIKPDGKLYRNSDDSEFVPCIHSNTGYYTIWTFDGQKDVHRIVAEAFIPNPEHLQIVDHINGNRQDNRVENLRWCTQKTNTNNAKNNRPIGKRLGDYASFNEYQKERMRENLEKNREKINAYRREWAKKNKDKIKNYNTKAYNKRKNK